jgi:hypothetical protein
VALGCESESVFEFRRDGPGQGSVHGGESLVWSGVVGCKNTLWPIAFLGKYIFFTTTTQTYISPSSGLSARPFSALGFAGVGGFSSTSMASRSSDAGASYLAR